jgi:hypothetical protein
VNSFSMRLAASVLLFSAMFTAQAQTVDPTPRIAALRHALAAGLVVDRENVVVIWEQPGDKLTPPELEAAKVEARFLARLVSPRARDTTEKAALECQSIASRARGAVATLRCASSTGNAVVVVSRGRPISPLARDTALVPIEVYSPGLKANERSMQLFTVMVTRAGEGWTGPALGWRSWPITPARIRPMVQPPGVLRGVREMSNGEQREMELAAVRHLLAHNKSLSFRDYGLDPRLYRTTWGVNANRDEAFSSHLTPGHNAGHLEDLAQALGTTSVIDDGTSCAVFRPHPCRIGKLAGVVQFSVGLVRSNSAEIALYRIARESPSSAESEFTGWLFTFDKKGTDWVVSGMRAAKVVRLLE